MSYKHHYHVRCTSFLDGGSSKIHTVQLSTRNPLEFGSDLEELKERLCDLTRAKVVLIDFVMPLKGYQRPAEADERPDSIEPVARTGPPWRTAADYPGYKENFQAEAAALFNAGLAAGTNWRDAQPRPVVAFA